MTYRLGEEKVKHFKETFLGVQELYLNESNPPRRAWLGRKLKRMTELLDPDAVEWAELSLWLEEQREYVAGQEFVQNTTLIAMEETKPEEQLKQPAKTSAAVRPQDQVIYDQMKKQYLDAKKVASDPVINVLRNWGEDA